MLSKSLLFAVSAVLATVSAQQEYIGFNYGSTKVDGSAKDQAYFKQEFAAAKSLAGTSGKFTSARLYTMVQAGTANDPISAIPAAIEEGTSLLLGLWASAGPEVVANEITALTRAIEQYGDDFAKLVVGISVGSEDLYRNSVMGIQAKAGIGGNPADIVNYINQVKKAISGTDLKGTPIGHVDTWTAWVNGTNSAVIDAVDWLGFDAYPYFQSTMPNSIEVSSDLFWQAFDNTQGVSKGKEVWITETGWPIKGENMNLAKADVPSAQSYWNQVGCNLFGKHKTWWYILEDVGALPEFGVIGSDGKPYYDLSCKNAVVKSTSSSAASVSPSTTVGPQKTAGMSDTSSSLTSQLPDSSDSSSPSSSSPSSSSQAPPSESQNSITLTSTNPGTTFAIATTTPGASSTSSSAGAATTTAAPNAASSIRSGSTMSMVVLQVGAVIGALVGAAIFTF